MDDNDWLLRDLSAELEFGKNWKRQARAGRPLDVTLELHDEDTPEAILAAVAFNQPTIKLRSLTDEVIEHRSPNGRVFSARELLDAVTEHERLTRGHSEWLGGVDIHHTGFAGIEPCGDGVWRIIWES